MDFFISNETFCDILHFLQRDEIEKCQLVCYKWDIFIDCARKILPKRLLNRILVDETGAITFLYNDHIKKTNEFNYLRKSMESNVANKCTIKHFIRALDFFDGIRILLGECFNIKTLNIYEPPEVNMQTVVDLRKFCSNIVCADEIILDLTEQTMHHILETPSLIHLPTPPTQIRLRMAAKSSYLVDSNALMTVIKDNDVQFASGAELLLYQTNISEDFCETFVRTFQQTKNPNLRFKMIKLENLSPRLHRSARQFLQSQEFPHQCEVEVALFRCIDEYRIKRKDGWLLKIILHAEEYQFSRTLLDLEFYIYSPEQK